MHVRAIAVRVAGHVTVREPNMNNFWGEPEDNDLPAWMDPKTYREGGAKFKGLHNKSLEQACADALKKPAVPVSIIPPTMGNDDDYK